MRKAIKGSRQAFTGPGDVSLDPAPKQRRVRAPGLTPRQLRAFRAAIGLDQRELAAMLGLSRLAIMSYEKGASRCGGKTAERIISLARSRGLYFTGANIPYEFRLKGVEHLRGDGVVAGDLLEEDLWVVNDVIVDDDRGLSDYNWSEDIGPIADEAHVPMPSDQWYAENPPLTPQQVFESFSDDDLDALAKIGFKLKAVREARKQTKK